MGFRQYWHRRQGLFVTGIFTLGLWTSGWTQETPNASAVFTRAQAAIDADTERLSGIFKDIHQNPELVFMETRTAGIVAAELKALGFRKRCSV